MALIRLSNIEKSFQDGEDRENNVLRGINMEVEKGEFIAIKGPSGSGKTTLLSILGTILRPDSGIYLLDGMEMTTDGNIQFLRRYFYRRWRQLPDVHERK